VKSVMAEFMPDVVNIHVAQGIGHNILKVSKAFPNTTFTYFLHDLALACVRTTMFKNGANCERQCTPCLASSRIKVKHLPKPSQLHFISPSRANAETVKSVSGLEDYSFDAIPNLDLSSPPERRSEAREGEEVRIIFVGRLEESKGIIFLMQILKELHDDGLRFHCQVVGSGTLLDSLRTLYEPEEWASFSGHVTEADVEKFVSESDVLVCPSLWREVLGNVVRQALRAGVPAIVTDQGGPKELVTNKLNGLILKAGDRHSWKCALSEVISDNNHLRSLQGGAASTKDSYNVDALGRRILDCYRSALAETRN
jgi:glycosyltransferase involved in cell wall biosynthesis